MEENEDDESDYLKTNSGKEEHKDTKEPNTPANESENSDEEVQIIQMLFLNQVCLLHENVL